MALGTEQGVIDLTGSSDSALIGRQLTKARAIVESMLSQKGIVAPTTDVVLDSAVEYITAGLIAIKPGAVNPRSQFKADSYSRNDGTLSQLDEYKSAAMELIDDYISSNDISAPPGAAVVGRVGRRVGTYTVMTDAEETNY